MLCMSNENTTPMNEIDKIKKEGALAALMARFEDLCDNLYDGWESVDLASFKAIRNETLGIINRLDLIVDAIEETRNEEEAEV